MLSPPLLEFDELLRPISDERPAGDDLRARPETKDGPATTPYYDVRDACKTARALERDFGERTREQSTAEIARQWRAVAAQASNALKQRTKDLDLVAWWIEALVRDRGWVGLRDGLRLARELIELYWDKQLYPLPDEEDGLAARVQQFVMLNGFDGREGVLVPSIRLIPFGSASANGHRLTIWSRGQAERSGADANGSLPTLPGFVESIAAMTDDEITNVLADIEACATEWSALEQAVASRCGPNALPSSNIAGVLDEALDCWRKLTKDRVAAMTPAEQPEQNGAAAASDGAVAATSAGARGALGPIQTRDDAFKALGAVAAFFRRTEPHSPIPFVLERAVRWGEMPLPELLEEWMGDREKCDPLFKLIGIPSKPESS